MKSISTIENPIRWKRATARGGAPLAAFIVLAALFQPISSHANLITNGDFESSVPSNSTGNGWTSTLIDGSGGWRDTGGNPNGNFILNEGGSAADPTISQTVLGLTPFDVYRLQGDVACGNVCTSSTALSFGALLDGTAILERTTPPTIGVYEHFSVDFTASSSTQAISFAGERNGSDIDPRIDNITLDLVPSHAVPEPGSLMLLLSGLAGVTGMAWRRRRRA